MSARRNWLVSVWHSGVGAGAGQSVLARVARVGVATFVALVALMGLRMGLLGTQRAVAGTHNIDPHCPPPPPPPAQFFTLAASEQVVRPGTEVIYTYVVTNPSPTHTLIDLVVEDSHLGPIPPTHFSLPPGEVATLTATATLTQNRTNSATLTGGVEGYSETGSVGPVTTTVHVIEGISLAQVYAEPPPVHHGDTTTLYYSIVNQDQDDGVVSGTVLIADSLGRTLDQVHFDLSPAATISQSSSFTVPGDIVVTLTATGWDDVQGVLSVSDQVTLTLCSEDIYEPGIELDLTASDQVVRPDTEVTYTYTVSNPSTVYTLTNVLVEDSHLGPISPTHFTLPPDESETLTAVATLTQNRTSAATATFRVEEYDGPFSGGPTTTTVHVIEGISLTQAYTEPPPIHHGDATALYYSVVNLDQDDGVVSGTVLITDSLGRTLDEVHFDLGPAATIPQASSSFTVPRDISITFTATGWDDVQRVLPVSDQTTLTLCPEDVYEPDNHYGEAHTIIPDEPPQLHDFFGDDDWVRFQVPRGTSSVYAFLARPLSPGGVPITLTLHHGLTPLTHTNNLNDPRLPVQIGKVLSCATAEGCIYFLQVESSASGCWTDYELWLEETPVPDPPLDLTASGQVVEPDTEVTYTYTISNPSTHTLTDVVVEDSHLGPIPLTFSLPPGEVTTLTATATLLQNKTSTATVTFGIEGYGGTFSGGSATATVHVIEGISLAQIYAEPPPVHYGDTTTLYYSVVNQDQDDGVISGTVLIADSLGRTLDQVHFDLSPAATVSYSSSFTVPGDIVVTLTAAGWDDVQGVLPVSDQATLTLWNGWRYWLPIVGKDW